MYKRTQRRSQPILIVESLERRLCLINPIGNSPQGLLVAAQLSFAAYTPYVDYLNHKNPPLPDGWSVDTNYGGSPDGGTNQLLVFVNTSEHQISMTFKGTNTFSQLESDLANSGGSAYATIMPMAVADCEAIKSDPAYAGYQVVSDGHSVAGGMAQSLSVQCDINGFGQNSLPIAQDTINADTNFSTEYSTWQSTGRTFVEVNVAGDIATFYYNTMQPDQLYLNPSPIVLDSPYPAIEQAGIALPGLGLGAAVALYAGYTAHQLGTQIGLLQDEVSNSAPSPSPNVPPTVQSAIASDASSTSETTNPDNSVSISESGKYNFTVTPASEAPNAAEFTISDNQSSGFYSLSMISGQGVICTLDDANVCLTDGSQARVNGSGNTISCGNNVTLLVGTGTNDVCTGAGNNDNITLQCSSSSVSLAGTNSVCTISGSGSNGYLNGSSEAAVATGSGETLYISGPSDTGYTQGLGEAAVATGTGETLYISGQNDNGYTQGPNEAAVATGPSETLYISGSGDNGYTQGSGEAAVATGTGETLYISGPGNIGYTQGPNEAAVATGSNETLYISGPGDTGYTQGSGEAAVASGTSETLYISGPSDNGYTQGSNEAAVATGPSETLYISGSGDNGYTQGSGEAAVATGTGETLYDSGSSSAAYVEGFRDAGVASGPAETVYDSGTDSTVYLDGFRDGAVASGPGESVNLNGSFDNAFLNVTGDGVTASGSNDTACFNGASTSIMEIFTPSASVSTEFEDFAGLNGTGTLNSQTYNWVTGGSEEIIYAFVTSGISDDIRNYQGANDTGLLSSETTDLTNGQSILTDYYYNGSGNIIAYWQTNGNTTTISLPNSGSLPSNIAMTVYGPSGDGVNASGAGTGVGLDIHYDEYNNTYDLYNGDNFSSDDLI